MAGSSRRWCPARVATGSGLRCRQYDEGAIFGQSQERQSRWVTSGTDGDGRCRARWHRRSGGLRRRVFTHSLRGPGEGPRRRIPARKCGGERPEGSGKADVPRLRPGTSPHLASSTPLAVFPSGRFDTGLGGAVMARGTVVFPQGNAAPDPVDPVNPIPDRLLARSRAPLHRGSRGRVPESV